MMLVGCTINFVNKNIIMGVVFTILGLIFLGFVLRGIFNDKSVADKPKDTYSWIAQLIISLLVGAFVWFLIVPKSCKKSSDRDPTDTMILKSE